MDSPQVASDFYSQVRCGLMHEGRTKGNWLISLSPKRVKVKVDSQFIIEEASGRKLLRTVFHYRLLAYLAEYQGELREQNAKGRRLRKFFARKMDHLFDFVPDHVYDWWK